MNDEQAIRYIEPGDDLTTVRERLEQVPSRKVTLVIDSQTQLRSHVAWKLLAARARELGKEVLIVSTDPQVRSIAHSVKFKVAHSSEASPSALRPKGGSATGRSNLGSSRRTASPSTTSREPTSKRGASRTPRDMRPPLSQQPPTWSESSSFAPPGPLDPRQPHLDEQHVLPSNETRPQRSNEPERNLPREERGSRYNQIFDFRSETPSPIRPLPITQIEEPDMLIEDYNRARDIRQAATESQPSLQKPPDSGPAIASPGNINTPLSSIPTPPSYQPASPVYGDDDPFIYMQDDSQPPPQAEQKGEATLLDDDISQEYPSLQTSISALPTNVQEKGVEYSGDEDDMIPPITPSPGRPKNLPIREDEYTGEEPSRLPTRPYDALPWQSRYDSAPSSGQTFDEDEPQLPGFPEPMQQAPQAIPLPMPRTPSKPLPIPSSTRAAGSMAQKTPLQKPDANSRTRNGPRIAQPAGNRPASSTTQPRVSTARPSIPGGKIRGPRGESRSRQPRRLLLLLASILVILALLFGFAYLNTASTVQITVTTQNYPHTVPLTLSNKNAPGAVPAKLETKTFTKLAPEAATGTTTMPSGNAIGQVYFTNTGTQDVEVPSQTIVTTAQGVQFLTKADVLILPNASVTLPVPIQAVNQGVSGNVDAGTITVIPPDSLKQIAQAPNSLSVTSDILAKTLTVTNPEPTNGGDAHQVPAVTQTDLDNAKKDLDNQVQPDIDAWVQGLKQNTLVGQPVKTDDAPTNPPTVGTPAPDGNVSMTISVTVTVLVAQVNDAQNVLQNQLILAVQADPNFGTPFTVIGGPQTIKIDLTQQQSGDNNTVTVPTTSQVGPSLNRTDLQNSIKGKSISDAQTTVRQKSKSITTVVIQTQPGIFPWVSPWADHINITVQSATK